MRLFNILILACVFWTTTGCNVTDYSQVSAANQRNTEIAFGQYEKIPFVNVGMVIDNSSSLQEEQQKVANAARDLVNSFIGRNLRFYLTSTTPHAETFLSSPSLAHYIQSLTTKVGDEYTFNPVGVATSNVTFSKPMFSIPVQTVSYTLDGETTTSMGETFYFDEIRMENKINESETPGGEPITLNSTDSVVRVNQVANEVRSAILAMGINGLDKEYTLCSAYKLAKNILPAGEPATILTVSDTTDFTGEQCFESSVLHRDLVSQSGGSLVNHSECASQGGTRDCHGDLINQYVYTPSWPVFEFSGRMHVDGSDVDVVNRRVQTIRCLDEEDGQRYNFCTATSFPHVFDDAELLALAKVVGAIPGSLTSGRVLEIPKYTWGASALFDPEEYPQDLRDVEFTFRGVQFDGVLDFVRNRGQEPHGGKINYYPSRSRFNSLATKFRRSYDFGSVALNDAYTEKGVSGLRQTMAQEIADISETRFPAFLYSSIQMQPGEENTACNQTGNGAPGLLQASLAEKVSEKFNGTSSVQSICASIYKLEEIKDFGDLFLLQTYEVPDLKDEESIISVGIKAANGEITPLVLGAKDTSLEEVGVVVEGKSLRLNLDVVKSILGIAELKNLSEQERSQIALIVGIVE